ncbi:hypothetical protein [Fervidobacterium islandicum]|uniref:hypothetical protein n=1 Tax=Fervidobacterium islandicum TaxID=2423 RepID=UPI003A66FD19
MKKQNRAGRKPKLTDAQIATLYVLSYVISSPVFKVARLLGEIIKHLSKRTNTKRTQVTAAVAEV